MKFLDPLDAPLDMLLRAAKEKFGCVCHTDNPELLKARLYKARSKFGELYPEILNLTVRTSYTDPSSEVWIVKSNLKEAAANVSEAPQEGLSGEVQIPHIPSDETGS